MTDTTAPDGAQHGALTEATLERAEPAAQTQQRRETREPDAPLAAAREFALAALKELVEAEDIGEGHRVVADDELLVTHLFASTRRGYRDWQWYVTLARAPGSEQPTVCESGMLPAQGALLAPEWVPWSQRVRDSDHEQPESSDGQAESSDGDPGGHGSAEAQEPESAESADSADSVDSADEAEDGSEDDDERAAAQPPRRVDATE